jgi:predicted Zn-dependent peptidase
MFVVTVLSFDNERTSKVFGAISDARRWASSDALNEFDGDVAGITIHQAEANDPRRAIDEVKSGVAKFIEGKAQPMTAEQADRAAKADAVRFLAKLGLNAMQRR